MSSSFFFPPREKRSSKKNKNKKIGVLIPTPLVKKRLSLGFYFYHISSGESERSYCAVVVFSCSLFWFSSPPPATDCGYIWIDAPNNINYKTTKQDKKKKQGAQIGKKKTDVRSFYFCFVATWGGKREWRSYFLFLICFTLKAMVETFTHAPNWSTVDFSGDEVLLFFFFLKYWERERGWVLLFVPYVSVSRLPHVIYHTPPGALMRLLRILLLFILQLFIASKKKLKPWRWVAYLHAWHQPYQKLLH